MSMNKRQIGTDRERAAGAYLESLGYCVLQYNYRCRYAEIDIVAMEGGVLAFLEVKYRRTDRFGTASEAVDTRKMQRICRAAQFYLASRHVTPGTPIRFDVVAVTSGRIEVIRNAFPYIES